MTEQLTGTASRASASSGLLEELQKVEFLFFKIIPNCMNDTSASRKSTIYADAVEFDRIWIALLVVFFTETAILNSTRLALGFIGLLPGRLESFFK
jgi:hypothetical protein